MGGSQLELFQQRDGQVRRVGAGREREDRWGGEGRERDENVRDGGIEGEAFAAAVQAPPTPPFGLQRRRHMRIDPKRPQSVIEVEHQHFRHWKPVREGLRRLRLGRKDGWA